MSTPRILIAGLSGGSGKTLVSLGLLAAWRKRGRRVAAFKKGPDYIDAAWMSMAAGAPCRNLDLFLMSPETIVRSFAASSAGAEIALVEGNRGVFDGMDAQGTYSTAELAKLLGAPVILAVNCTKATRTIAALVLGCQRLDPDLPLSGVILNQTASHRHESVVRESIERICGLPVLGAIRRLPEQLFPERHLGLVPPDEHGELPHAIQQVAAAAETYLDLEAIDDLARQAPALAMPALGATGCLSASADTGRQAARATRSTATNPAPPEPLSVRIGVFRDAAFQFYYPENIETLGAAGAEVIEISPLRDTLMPEVDALYMGGGFPETAALSVAENKTFLDSLRQMIEQGLPVYAECGGAVFLGEKLLMNDKTFPMAGVLPVTFTFGSTPRGHGYSILETVAENPFFPVGQSWRGHEFHYTYMHSSTAENLKYAFRVRRGYGFDGQHDGLCYRNVLASYMHVHALGTETWAPALVGAALRSPFARK